MDLVNGLRDGKEFINVYKFCSTSTTSIRSQAC